MLTGGTRGAIGPEPGGGEAAEGANPVRLAGD